MSTFGYRIMADAVKWFHAAFVLFALVGAIFTPLSAVILWLHLPILAWAVGINWGGCACPLTPLENRLRSAAGEGGYGGGFIQHYLERAGLAGIPRRQLEIRVAWVLLLWNVAVYVLLYGVF